MCEIKDCCQDCNNWMGNDKLWIEFDKTGFFNCSKGQGFKKGSNSCQIYFEPLKEKEQEEKVSVIKEFICKGCGVKMPVILKDKDEEPKGVLGSGLCSDCYMKTGKDKNTE